MDILILQTMKELREEITRHEYLYYVECDPVITDEEYDILVQRLEDIEKAFPELITSDSPTQRVGSDLK